MHFDDVLLNRIAALERRVATLEQLIDPDQPELIASGFGEVALREQWGATNLAHQVPVENVLVGRLPGKNDKLPLVAMARQGRAQTQGKYETAVIRLAIHGDFTWLDEGSVLLAVEATFNRSEDFAWSGGRVMMIKYLGDWQIECGEQMAVAWIDLRVTTEVTQPAEEETGEALAGQVASG